MADVPWRTLVHQEFRRRAGLTLNQLDIRPAVKEAQEVVFVDFGQCYLSLLAHENGGRFLHFQLNRNTCGSLEPENVAMTTENPGCRSSFNSILVKAPRRARLQTGSGQAPSTGEEERLASRINNLLRLATPPGMTTQTDNPTNIAISA